MAQIVFAKITLFKLLCCVSLFSIAGCQDWAYSDDGCRTPDRGVGECIPAKQCKPMVDLLTRVKKPISQSTLKRINAYTCSYEGTTVFVCCPDSPIIIPNEITPTSPPVVVRSPPDVTGHKNFNLLPVECGYQHLKDKIKNGIKANLMEFPWMALLNYKSTKSPNFKCGGTIINDRWILTAAHCISELKQSLISVRVGENDILTDKDCEKQNDDSIKCADPVQDVAIEKIIAHPDFSRKLLDNDIGLIKVAKMNLSVENAKPVCLPTDEETRNAVFANSIVSGWGYTETGYSSNTLQKVALPTVSEAQCKSAYRKEPNVRITYKQLCAGGKNDKDSCGGDSGGPLQVASFVNDEIRYVQHGIVSFGPAYCGLAGYPGVYTRVAYYMDWILDNIGS